MIGYEYLKKNPNLLIDYNEILLYFTDLYRIKAAFAEQTMITKDEADKYFDEHYTDSELFYKLAKLNMSQEDIYQYMSANKDLKYSLYKSLFDELVKMGINLCRLVDYIGHYPKTYPVPKEEEKNPEMEALLEKHDIMVRYYLGDIDNMQILSNDVVRIREAMKETALFLDELIESLSDNDWLFERLCGDEAFRENYEMAIEEINCFPLSYAQMNGKSEREEGKKYLRLQHGEGVI